MARFFVDSTLLQMDQFALIDENAAHAKVLRLRCGEIITVCDGMGNECICQVDTISDREVGVSVIDRKASNTEAAVHISVYVAFPKADKLEHVIQKATELGAFEIVAFPTSRCVSKPDEKSLKKKLERWQKIAAAAAEQSGRGLIPQVRVLNSYMDALREGGRADLPILLYENEESTTLRMALESEAFQSVVLLSGPEGGLEMGEVEKAQNAGFHVCTLGKRILRCETAPLCALSAVMYAVGEF